MIEGVRKAATDDVGVLVGFAEAFVGELTPMRGGALWAVLHGPTPPLAEHFTALLGEAGTTVLVGTIDSTPVGYAVMRCRELRDGSRLAAITELFVEPDARAVGIGDAIVGELVAQARAQGCAGIDATALPGHRATKNFFEGQGFVARSLTMHHPLTGS